MSWITVALAALDWGIARAEAAGEEIPQEYLEQRTEARRELARQADNEAAGNES